MLFLSIHYHHQDKTSCSPDTFDHLAKDEKNKTKLGCFATKISSFSTACSTPPTWARMDRWLKQPLARLSHRGFSGNLPSRCSKLLRTARKQSSLQEFSHGTYPAVGKAESGNSASTATGEAEKHQQVGTTCLVLTSMAISVQMRVARGETEGRTVCWNC